MTRKTTAAKVAGLALPVAVLVALTGCGTDQGSKAAPTSAQAPATAAPALSVTSSAAPSSAAGAPRITSFVPNGAEPPAWAYDFLSALSANVGDGSVSPGTASRYLNIAILACNQQADGGSKDAYVKQITDPDTYNYTAKQASAVWDEAPAHFCQPARSNLK